MHRGRALGSFIWVLKLSTSKGKSSLAFEGLLGKKAFLGRFRL